MFSIYFFFVFLIVLLCLFPDFFLVFNPMVLFTFSYSVLVIVPIYFLFLVDFFFVLMIVLVALLFDMFFIVFIIFVMCLFFSLFCGSLSIIFIIFLSYGSTVSFLYCSGVLPATFIFNVPIFSIHSPSFALNSSISLQGVFFNKCDEKVFNTVPLSSFGIINPCLFFHS